MMWVNIETNQSIIIEWLESCWGDFSTQDIRRFQKTINSNKLMKCKGSLDISDMKPRAVKESSRCMAHTKQLHPLEQPCVVQDIQAPDNTQSKCTNTFCECMLALQLHCLSDYNCVYCKKIACKAPVKQSLPLHTFNSLQLLYSKSIVITYL